MSYDQNRNDNNAISISTRKKARIFAIIICVTIFTSGVIQKLIEKLF
ncbi:MAG TPA: hypothetical protein VK072_06360 [Candidatus Avamphibacillus sp.]|nr:hypothetical protein [Candidatus Avamphibacillus sp.]